MRKHSLIDFNCIDAPLARIRQRLLTSIDKSGKDQRQGDTNPVPVKNWNTYCLWMKHYESNMQSIRIMSESKGRCCRAESAKYSVTQILDIESENSTTATYYCTGNLFVDQESYVDIIQLLIPSVLQDEQATYHRDLLWFNQGFCIQSHRYGRYNTLLTAP